MRVLGREENVLIEEKLPGQALGWSAIIPSHQLTLTATATFEAEVLELPREPLLKLFAQEPAVGYVVARNAADIAGRRLQVFQAMWLREMQRVVRLRMRGQRETA
jgi:CRP-like cAMP-binding protein